MGLSSVNYWLFCRVNMRAGMGASDGFVNMGAGAGSWLGFINMGAGVGSLLSFMLLRSVICSTLFSSVAN